MGFINLGMRKSRSYGIGSLIWRSSISISSKLLTMQRQQSSTKRTGSPCGKKKEEGDTEGNQEDVEGDSHEHAAEHEREEQREAEIEVQG